MPLQIIQNDITKVHVDAIVNSSDSLLSGQDGMDKAIHLAAGPELSAECRTLGSCRVGEAKITRAYQLPARYIIHTVAPCWSAGLSAAADRLAACYANALRLAEEYQLESIALPLMGVGQCGFPKDKALQTAISVIGGFLLSNEMTVFLVVPDRAALGFSEPLYDSITRYIDDKFMDDLPEDYRRRQAPEALEMAEESPRPMADGLVLWHSELQAEEYPRTLEDVVNRVGESFSQMLLRLIAERGMTESQAYKKANVDRRHFSKIRNDIGYRPTKPTVLAFAIALELSLDETKDLLLRAGFALSHSSKFDLIIEYFIDEGNYNIFEINEALFAFEQDLLGL